MRKLRRAFVRLAGLFDRRRREREIADEFESHFALHVEENLRRGMTAAEAHREARLKFGGMDSARESMRETSGIAALENLWRDLRYAVRGWRRNPGFAATAILSLALGIGASVAIFTLTDNLLLRPLPYPDASRLAMVWETNPHTSPRNSVSPANYLNWKSGNDVFATMAAFGESRQPLADNDRAEQIWAQHVTADLLPMLRVPPYRGRLFTAADDKPGAARVAIVSYRLWQSWFGGEQKAIGRQVQIGPRPATIIGVMPPGFYFRNRNIDVWLPLGLDPSRDYYATSGRYLMCAAQLKPGVTLDRAQSEMTGIAKRLEAEHPVFNTHWRVNVESLRESLVSDLKPAILTLLGAVGLLLGVACANVANLLLARYASRRREMAARAAIGAGRGRLIRQLVTESVALGVAGGALGLALARWLVLRMVQLAPLDLTRNIEISFDYRVALFAAAISVLTGLVFGLAPGLIASRSDLMRALREDSRTGATGGKLRAALVAAEVALSVVLLSGAGLLFRSVLGLEAEQPGLNPDHVLTFHVTNPASRYSAVQRTQFFARALDEIERLPGVESASALSFLPFDGIGAATDFKIEGRPPAKPGESPSTAVHSVMPGYFRTMQIPLKRGRWFTGADNTPDSPYRFVVSQALVDQYFHGQDPLGQHISVDMDVKNPFGEIIGVVADVKGGALDKAPEPTAYYIHAHLVYSDMQFVVRTKTEPLSLAGPIRRIFHDLDPAQPVAQFRTMDAVIRETFARQSFSAILLAAFSAAALLLAAIGIYGVLAYAVTERTREIGVRVALGASPSQIVSMVLRGGMLVVFSGAAAGIAAAYALTGFLTALLFSVRAHDPFAFTAAPAVLLAAALLAAYLPARRASRVDPANTLRME